MYCYKDSDSLRRSKRTHPLKVRPSRQHLCVQLQGSDWSGEKTAHRYKDSASCAAAAQPTLPQLPLGPVETKLGTVTRNRGTSNFTCAQLQGSGKQRAIFAYSYTDPIEFELILRTVTGKWSLGGKICAQLQESAFSRNHISDYLLSGRHVSRMCILVTIACGRVAPHPPARPYSRTVTGIGWVGR